MKIAGKVKTVGGAAPKTEWSPAHEAVKRFEEMRSELDSMKDEFEERFPEAVVELRAIKELEDEIQEHIEKTKLLVRDAKETVGDFKLKRRYSKAGYDADSVLEIMRDTGDWSLFPEMFEAGAIKSISLDQEGLALMFDSREDERDRYAAAWKEKEELTPAVTVPKI